MINVKTVKVTETRNVTFVGKIFGEIYNLENFLAYQTLHERYVLEEQIFDTGLKTIKEEDDEYDKETYFKEEKTSDNLSQESEGSSRTVRLARNQEELDSIDRSTRDFMKLETFNKQDSLCYLNAGDSDFEDLDMGHVVTETDFFGGGE